MHNFQFFPVVSSKLYSTEPKLLPVIVAKLAGTRKTIQAAIKSTLEFPNTGLKHIRRVRDIDGGHIECVICLCLGKNVPEQAKELEVVEKKLAQTKLFKDFRLSHVPSTAPATEQQLKIFSKIWPCKLARNAYLIKCLEGDLMTQKEKNIVSKLASEILRYKKKIGNSSITVIFKDACIYGTGLSQKEDVLRNPLKHSVMVAIDDVALREGSGLWKEPGAPLSFSLKLGQSLLEGGDSDDSHSSMYPYLCTKYDVITSEEPCYMCAMALIHSRIRRLYFIDGLELGTKTSVCCYKDDCAITKGNLHCISNLNHAYEALRIDTGPELS